MGGTKSDLLVSYLSERGLQVRPQLGYQSVKCPFHDDRNPSASVNLTKGRFNCFTCEMSGDVYDLIQKEHNVDFKTAQDMVGKVLPSSNEPTWI